MRCRQIKFKKDGDTVKIEKSEWRPAKGMDRILVIDDAQKTEKTWSEMNEKEIIESIDNLKKKSKTKRRF